MEEKTIRQVAKAEFATLKSEAEKARDELLNCYEDAVTKAQTTLGAMYLNGLGLEQDYYIAFEWFDKAAVQGFAEAQYNLGVMHAKGRGVLGMKIFGENGFESAEQRMASLKYVLGLGAVDAFTIGFTSIEQIDETLAMIPKASVA